MPTPPPKRTLLHLTDLHFDAAPSKGHFWNSESTELELPEHDPERIMAAR